MDMSLTILLTYYILLGYLWCRQEKIQINIPSRGIILSQIPIIYFIYSSILHPFIKNDTKTFTYLANVFSKFLIIILFLHGFFTVLVYIMRKEKNTCYPRFLLSISFIFVAWVMLFLIAITLKPFSFFMEFSDNLIEKITKFKSPKDRYVFLQTLSGIFQGILATYVFSFSLMYKSKGKKIKDNEFLETLRSSMGAMTFFLAILSLSSLILKGTAKSIYWTIRLSVWLLPPLTGFLAVSSGFIYGKKNNPLAKYIGFLLIFSIALTTAVLVIPFIEEGKLVFSSTIAFSYNCILLIGLLAYLINNTTPLTNLLKHL